MSEADAFPSTNRSAGKDYLTPEEVRSRRVSLGLWVAAGLLVVAFVVTRFLDWEFDKKNVVGLITLGGATVLAWIQFVFFSRQKSWIRQRVLVVSVALLALCAACLRFEGFTGDMEPTVAWRWSPVRDTTLSKLEGMTDAEVEVPRSIEPARDYPQFLGADGRGALPEVRLARDWRKEPPEELWRHEIGAGWSAFAIVGNMAVTQEQRGDDEYVSCYDIESGELVWAHSDPERFESVLGGIGPRATPTIAPADAASGMYHVYTLGATGRFNCLDLATGGRLWTRDVLEENGATNLEWGRSSSPLVVGSLVILSAGGTDGRSLVAYDRLLGELVWASGDDVASYASPIHGVVAGVEQVIAVNEGFVVGYRLEDGQELWRHEWPSNSDGDAATSQPVLVGDDRVFLSKGYGHGAELIKVSASASETTPENFKVTSLWRNPRVMQTKMTNVVMQNGYVYGLSGGILECIELETGKRQWKRGRYGHGQVMLLGDLLLVLSEAGELLLIEASPAEHKVLGQIQALNGKAWNNPALSRDRLLLRNGEEAVCYELPLAAEAANDE